MQERTIEPALAAAEATAVAGTVVTAGATATVGTSAVTGAVATADANTTARPLIPPVDGRAATLLPSLTGLRWVTAMLIFGHHIMAVQYFGGEAGVLWAQVFSPGSAGVTMFFVLSGFVLTWSYRPGQGAGDFWVRRLARVYPLHLVGVALAIIIGATILPLIATHSADALTANVLLISSWDPSWWQAGNPVSWSLVCEAFFYLCFPLLIRVLARRPTAVLAGVAAFSVVLVSIAPLIAGANPLLMSAYSTPALRLPEFVIGICAALLLRSGAWRPPRLAFSVGFAVAGYVASAADALPGTQIVPGTAFAVLSFGVLIASLADCDRSGLRTGLTGRTWQALGRASFAFYVVHLLIIGALGAPWPDGHPQLGWRAAAVLAGVALVAAIGLALLLHRTVEVPLQRAITHSLLGSHALFRRRASVSGSADGRTSASGRTSPVSRRPA